MKNPEHVGVEASSLTVHDDGALRGVAVKSVSPSNVSLQANSVISESQVWLDLARQSRLRIENMRTMHRLAFSSARARWTAQSIEESIKTGQNTTSNGTQSPLAPEFSHLTGLRHGVTAIAGAPVPATHDGIVDDEEVSRMDPLYWLPDDLLICVFSYLPFHELITLQRVSKAWFSYIFTEPRLYRHVSFLHSRHQIPLKALRAAITNSAGRISSLEFDASTLVHLTPLAPIYPYLRRLVISHQTGFMSTVFRIAFQIDNSNMFYNLPNLRTAIFKHGILLSNEVVTLLSMAPNLEELECRSARVILDLLGLTDGTTRWKLKRLSILHYSEVLTRFPADFEESVQTSLIRTPALLRFLPYLEELTLGIDSLQVMDLTLNPRLTYVDFLRGSAVTSFIQPPPSLRVCLNAPVLNRHLPDSHPVIWPPGNNDATQVGEHIQLWARPPSFESLSLSAIPSAIAVLPKALCNSYCSLGALRFSFAPRNWGVTSSEYNTVVQEHLETLPGFLTLFENLRFLDVSDSQVNDLFLTHLAVLSLEYLCLARTSVTSSGVIQFLSKSRGKLKMINLVETQVGVEVGEVAETFGIKMEVTYPGQPMPGVIHSSY